MIIVWRITECCNLRCPFCAYDCSLPKSRRIADPNGVRQLARMLARQGSRGDESTLISWSGGEPLLWPPLFEVTAALAQETSLRFSLTTNGFSLGTTAVRARLRELFDEVTISVDGLGASHDRLRRWPGGFDSVCAGINALADDKRRHRHGPRLRVNIVAMRDNVRELTPLCLALSSCGVEELTFNQLGGRERPEFYAEHHLTSEDVEQLGAQLPVLRAQLYGLGVALQGGERYLERLRATAARVTLEGASCQPGRGHLFIDVDGRVAPCCFTINELYAQGIELVRDVGGDWPSWFGALRDQSQPAECRDCHSTQLFGKYCAE